AGKVPSPAATLADSALRALWLSKVKLLTAVVGVLAALGLGAALVTGSATEAPTPASANPTEAPADARGRDSGDGPKPVIEAKARLDRFGDPLPPGAVARLGTLRFRENSVPAFLLASPDGKLLATAGACH